eukprot:EC799535.1.p1 GENE.EC799535.1~~EC799535.1.p1  ORF type:complete len:227 (+),score=56.38 EC799535.1:92-682(+)
MRQLKSQLRAAVFRSMAEDEDSGLPPPLSEENLLINELIREYLEYNKYRHTMSVFLPESGQPESLDRRFVTQQLHVSETQRSGSVPLLYGIVNMLKEARGGGQRGGASWARRAPGSIGGHDDGSESRGASYSTGPSAVSSVTPPAGAAAGGDGGGSKFHVIRGAQVSHEGSLVSGSTANTDHPYMGLHARPLEFQK